MVRRTLTRFGAPEGAGTACPAGTGGQTPVSTPEA